MPVSPRRYRWVVLAVVYLSFLAFAVVFQSMPPILGLVLADLRLSHAEGGLLMSLFALPGVLLSIPVGLLVDRYGPRALTALCLGAMILGSLLVAEGRAFPVLAVGRVLAGAGGLSLFVVGSQYVAGWFAGRELGTAVGIYSTCMPVGTILALNVLPAVAAAAGWRVAVLVGVALALLALAAFGLLYRPAPSAPGARSAASGVASLAAAWKLGLPIWLVGAIWMLFNAAVISFLTFGPDYFVSLGYGVELAGFLTSFLMLFSVPLAPVVGYLLGKLDHAALVAGLGGLLVALAIFVAPLASLPLVASLTLLGVGAALVPTSVFDLPPKLLRPEQVGVGYGVVSTCLNVGVVVGPYLVGLARDVTGSYRLGFDLMALFALLGALAAGALGLTITERWRSER